MPKLLFTPKFHTIGDNTDYFCTSCKYDEPVVFIRCNEMGKFILEQMHPEHKPRKEIVPLVMERFGCSYNEAVESVEAIISAPLKWEGGKNVSKTAAKKLSEKLAKLISSNFTVSEIKLYTKAEQADALSFDTMYLWVLKNHFGFTAEQLIKVFSTVSKEAVQFEDYSLSGKLIPPILELKEFGVDIELLAKEVY